MASPPPSSLPEKATNNHHHHLRPLPCPRCNSGNTKFCYYNNYSLSQPRHFCKACKRYWTRGGTLRNVPVGGTLRKNKRQKRTANPKIDLPPQRTSNPLYYNNPNEAMDFPFAGFRSTRVCGESDLGFDFYPQVNGLGLGFSSGLMAAADHSIFYGASSGFASLLAMGKDLNPNPNYYSDPTSLLGAWFDPSNGSSVPSLI